jgi:hypothetical protein
MITILRLGRLSAPTSLGSSRGPGCPFSRLPGTGSVAQKASSERCSGRLSAAGSSEKLRLAPSGGTYGGRAPGFVRCPVRPGSPSPSAAIALEGQSRFQVIATGQAGPQRNQEDSPG